MYAFQECRHSQSGFEPGRAIAPILLLFGEVCPENSREIGRFFREFAPKNTAKFDFFVRDLSEALLRRKGVQISVPLKMKMSPKILTKGTNCPPVIKS